MFDPLGKLVLGLATGFVFGFLLQKGAVTKFDVIVRQFLLRDFTMLRVMLTAVVVGGFGTYALVTLGLAELSVKPALLAAVALGGAVFGVGMVVLGYCPGTGVGAAAEGSRHATVGLVGMVVGAAVYSEVYAYVSKNLLTWADYGKTTLPMLLGVSPWVVLAVVAVVAVALLYAGRRLENGHRNVFVFTRSVRVRLRAM